MINCPSLSFYCSSLLLIPLARLLDIVYLGIPPTVFVTCGMSLALLVPSRLFLGKLLPLVQFDVLGMMVFLYLLQLGLGNDPLFDVFHRDNNDDVGNHKGDLGFL